jgi:hypothetical protein
MGEIKKIVFTGGIVFLLTFCHNDMSKKNDLIPTLKVTEDLIQHNVKFSGIIRDYKFIPLETSENVIIGHIDKIILHNNQYYILDSRRARSIFVFSSSGKFLWKLSKQRKGPGE